MSSHDHGNEKEIMKKKENAWLEQKEITNVLDTIGAEEFFSPENFADRDSLFVESKEKLCCIDEGVFNIEDESHKMALAGSGILFPAGSREERLNRVAEICKNKGIKHITSHEGCGAANMAWEAGKKNGEKEAIDAESADAYGKNWSIELTAVINQTITEKENIVDHKYVSKDLMIRPPEFHDARTVWFDMTSKFHPDAAKQLPKGFLIDYGVARDEGKNEAERQYPFAELKVAISIAFGDHGFGSKFTEDNPFIIVAVSNSEAELDDIKEQIAETIDKDEKTKAHADKIKIDGFIK